MSAEAAAATRVSPLRVAVASFIGTTVEFYDFLIYGTAAALVFPKLFFPNASPASGVLLSFATFGVGFFARPLGGMVFGHFGDRLGRKRMLVYSLLGMGFSTILIGLLPTYAHIGVAAPILLTLLRLVQGFAVGGEWGGATLMAVEHASPERKGFYGAFPQMGAPAGTAAATLAFFLVSQLPDDQFLSWGWRIPFLFSAVLIVIGLVIRLTLSESPEFAELRATSSVVRMPIADAFRKHWRQILLVAGSYLSQGVFAYICVAYLVAYGTTVAGIDRTWALFGVFVAAVVAVVMYPLFGSLSDRVGRKASLPRRRCPDGRDHRSGVRIDQHGQASAVPRRAGAGVRLRDGTRRRRHRGVVLHGLRCRRAVQRRLDRLHALAGGRLGVRPDDRGGAVQRDQVERRDRRLSHRRLGRLGRVRVPAAGRLAPSRDLGYLGARS